ncbi:MAG: hypothetical protein LBM06_06540 [Prevotellaceae bacterium]|jgi:hypothetical protein|nr:hypothetical protein [Prevotellaceae bacterium]
MTTEKKKKKNSRMNGDMNFTYENVNQSDGRNTAAEDFLFEAWATAGYHGKPGEDYYPRTQNETQTMEDLLDKAEAAVDDPSDRELLELMADTREVIAWSKKRHWTFAWWIIICVTIMGIYYLNSAGDAEKDLKKATSPKELQSRLDSDLSYYNGRIANYKYELTQLEGKSDSASQAKRTQMKAALKSSTEHVEMLKTGGIEYLRKLRTESSQKEEASDWKMGIWCFIWIVVYVVACRPRGYMITKRRREDKAARGLKKALFWIAGLLVGTAGALRVTTTVTKWSDGSTTRDDDGIMIYAMKFGLIAVAVLIVLWTARVIIVISAILGLIRNYDWVSIAKDPKNAFTHLK